MNEYEWEPETEGDAKRIITIFGTKGVGKTSCALGFAGKIYVISMDDKTIRVWIGLYGSDPRIVVLKGTKYYSFIEKEYVEAGVKTYNYVLFLIEEIRKKGDADWICIDGLERIHNACEMVMRAKNKLGPFQGFPNLMWWKQRRLALREIQARAVDSAKKGVIYTTYSENDDLFIQDGKPVIRKQKPKWLDIVEESTDIVIRVWIKDTEEAADKNNIRFMATITTSKFEDFPTGENLDITGRTIENALNLSVEEGTVTLAPVKTKEPKKWV
jgi:hypothetical protein